MGQVLEKLQGSQWRERQVRMITDKVFDHFKNETGKANLTFEDLYIAVLLVYNDINKRLPGPHFDPPSKEQVKTLMLDCDINLDGELDRKEFVKFIIKLTADTFVTVSKGLMLTLAAAPTLALVTKKTTEGVPGIGKVVHKTAVITGFSALPWLIKPLYGFISDSFPLFGYRRRSYLVLSGLLGALSWSLMALFVDSKYSAAFCILLGSLSVAFSDVVVDSMVVERARGESQSLSGSLQSLCWGSSAFGGIVSSYFSGSLVDVYGVRYVFGITALLPLITSAVAVLVNEQRVLLAPARGQNVPLEGPGFLDSSKYSIIQLWEAVRQRNVFLPTLFIFLWQATPHSESAMFYFTTNKLGFTPEFLGRVKLVTSVASLLGVGLYNGFLKNVPMRKIFFATTTLGTALGMTQVILVTGLNRQLGISDEWFAIGDSLILTVLGQASFMPVLVLAARLCPQGMEATLFATLMSVSNGGSVIGGLLGAGLTQLFGVTKDRFDNLATLIILCNLSSLLPLPLLGLLPCDNSPDASSTDSGNIEIKSN